MTEFKVASIAAAVSLAASVAILPIAIPIYVLLDAGAVRVFDALMAMTIIDACKFLGTLGGAGLTIFVIGRKVQRFIDHDTHSHEQIDQRLAAMIRGMEAIELSVRRNEARTRGRFRLMFDRAVPQVSFQDVVDAENESMRDHGLIPQDRDR